MPRRLALAAALAPLAAEMRRIGLEPAGDGEGSYYQHVPLAMQDRRFPDSLAGGAGRGRLTGFERSTLGETLAAAGLPVGPDRRPEYDFFERSDNYAFARRGVVAHTLSSYDMHRDYHQPSDEVSRVDLAHMTRLVEVTARAARLLVDGPRVEWKPNGRP